ncbi:zinc finger matrin-type protein 1-like isoform X2 [Seriola lalandi dorsalis]|uniref:zinc finger matrin-type protein 1-like isoform X2 n=1 Tax=Seriola lalandi dorsalis TaxID=1841481 RepID=UPI000C6F6A82|nr:zinc finger matrin-type protein 1-like isoform X2 [Seriola lalandi dorsalis]
MDDTNVCPPLLAESDAQNNTTSTPNAASVTDADKVINTKIDSTQIEGDKNEEELLKGLLTDDYCHVCEAVLLFESQRLSHYEGKKHAQKLKVYLQAKKGEKINKEFTAPQQTMTTDKDRFCELCNMVFSSHLVAKSHYEGKVHAKNLRKQGLQPPVMNRNTEACTLPRLTPDNANQKSAPEDGMEHPVDPAAATTAPSTEVDLKDPNKCCALCAASFNNPQMALQHYNGRKHQRNQARQELMKELGDNVQQANSLVCQMCSVQFNSVEMYQAHVQGNKHQIREKKVVDLCKSQQKSYSTFADELADYIQVQKARGINPKTSQVLPQGDTQKEDEEDEEEVQEVFNKEHIIELSKPVPNLPPASDAPHQFGPGCYYPAEGWRPPYPGPPRLPHGWDYNCPPPGFSASGAPQFAGRPIKRKSRRTQSSSSSCTTSSSYSSSYSSSNSSSTSDSDDNKYKRRERRRIRRSRKERGRRSREEDSHKEERRRKRQRKERDNESEERKKEEFGESQQERRRNKQKKHGKQRRKEKKSREEEEGGERVMDNLKPEDMMDNRKYTEVHIQAEINVEQGEGGQDESAKPKYRREKKKVKEKVDTRTEEEKLWDDSILGC